MRCFYMSVYFRCVLALCGLVAALALAGCEAEKPSDEPEEPRVVVARYTDTPVVIDGVLDDSAWEDAEVYYLGLSKDRADEEVIEKGKAMVAWDDDYLYVGVKFYDSDIVAEGTEDQLHHYRKGDLAEVFLKPADHTWYWELYVTPAGHKTEFFLPGRGRLWLDSIADYSMGMRVAATYSGTLNNWEDVDDYWIGEMAIPVSELTARGEEFGPGADWTILIARYNFSRYLYGRELSMYPPLSATNYHLIDEYAVLELVK